MFSFRYWALIGISILAFTAFLDATIVNTALPFIQTALNTTILELQWVTNIFTIVLSMTMIAMGKIADVWGRKKVFYCGVALFAMAAWGAGLSPNIGWLVFFRALQALGASIIFVVSSALLTDIFPENERLNAISIYGGVTGFGLMLGPFLGGILIQLLGWRWVFWINLPLIAAGFAACSFSLRGLPRSHHIAKIDSLSLLLLVIGLGSLMYGIVDGAEKHWSSPVAWTLLTVGIGALILLIIFDKLRKNPLLDLHIFNEKIIVLGALSCALAGVVSTVFMFFDPLYLRILRQLPPLLIGLLIAVIPAAQAIISFVFSRAVKKFGVTNLLFFSILAALSAVALHRAIGHETPLLFLILPFFLLGINWGLSNSAMITAVNQVIAPHEIGAAIGTLATVWNIVGSILLAASTAVFYAEKRQASFLSAFQTTVTFNIVFATIIALLAVWIFMKIRREG